mgnify:CR=1 FL=1
MTIMTIMQACIINFEVVMINVQQVNHGHLIVIRKSCMYISTEFITTSINFNQQQTSITLIRCEFIHLVKVFFCISSRSSIKENGKMR